MLKVEVSMARTRRGRQLTGGNDRASHGRRRRKVHRRDIERGTYYEPMLPSRHMAQRGVHSRLGMAAFAGFTTLVCVIAFLFSFQTPFAMAALSIVGFCSFIVMLALVLSARREETLHRIANREPVARLTDENGFDGSVG